MKVIGKILLGIVSIIYLIIVVFLTACLLNYNDYNVTEFSRDTLVIIGRDTVGNYKEGDLVVVYKNLNKDINTGDNIFFYDTTSKENVISFAKVEKAEKVTSTETTFTIEGGYKLSSEYVIGKEETAKAYSKVGKILSILESRWGFVLFVIFPILLIFIYEIYSLIMEIKESKNDEEI